MWQKKQKSSHYSTYQNTTLKWIAKPYGSNLELFILIGRKQQFEIYHFACFCQEKKNYNGMRQAVKTAMQTDL